MIEIGRKNVIQDEFMMENPSSSNIPCPIIVKVIKYSNVLDVNVCIWLNIGKQINFNYDLGMDFKNSSFVFYKMRCFFIFARRKNLKPTLIYSKYMCQSFRIECFRF